MKRRIVSIFLLFLLSGLLAVTAGAMGIITPDAGTEAGFNYLPWEDGVRIEKYLGSDTAVVIPDTLGGKPVTQIGAFAFYQNTAITSVTVPETVTRIGQNAFDGCTALEAVRLSDSIRVIETWAFHDCTSLMAFSYPVHLESCADSILYGCTSLTEVTIPEGVTTLAPNVFYRAPALELVELPRSLTKISARSFRDCPALGTISIPDSVQTIEDSAFSASEHLVFACGAHSAAAYYAIAHNIPIEETGSIVPAGSLLDYDRCFYGVNQERVSATGKLALVAQYAFLPGAAPSAMIAEFRIPASVTLADTSVTVDGVPAADYTVEGPTLRVPLTNPSGTIRMLWDPQSYSAPITSYAAIHFTSGGQAHTELINHINLQLPTLQLSVPKLTGQSTFRVSGFSVPGSRVALAIDGIPAATVTANKAGDFAAELTLTNPVHQQVCQVSATCGGQTVQKNIICKKSLPKLLSLELCHNGGRHKLTPNAAISPVISIRPGRPYRFLLTFDRPELVEQACVVSTRGHTVRYLEAHWNEKKGIFEAEGFFDPNNHSYVPGNLTVKYSSGKQPLDFETGMDLDTMPRDLTPAWLGAEVTVNPTASDRDLDYVVTSTAGQQIHVTHEQQDLPSGLTPETASVQGYQKLVDNNGNTRYAKFSPEGTYTGQLAYLWADFEAQEFGSLGISVIDNVADTTATNTIATGVGLISLVDGVREDQDILYTYCQMRQDVMDDPSLSDAAKDFRLQQLTQAQVAHCGSVALSASLTITSFCLDKVPVVGKLGASLINALMDHTFGAFQNMYLDMMYDMMQDVQTEQINVRLAIDPSGYLYDAQSGTRLPGATVTAYWIPPDPEDPEFWNKLPDEQTYGKRWNAAEYSQENPQQTDADGRYAWDVPEGWWRIQYEKPGYHTTWSKWLPVPPIQTDVNIPMEDGYVFTCTKLETDGAAVTVSNDAGAAVQASLLLAAYDQDGKMLERVLKTQTLGTGSDCPLQLAAPNKDLAYVRVFVLEPGTLVPQLSPWEKHLVPTP